jgi:outer membrane protein assembly factor BamE (lipoprotein component of BamABCDE complex)
MNSIYKSALLAIALIAVSGCSTTQYGVSEPAYSGFRSTANSSERKVVLGMGSANIAAVLGSPSIVADHQNKETTWTYDGISSDVSYARNGDAIVGVIFDRSFDNSITREMASALQPTLTVVIRFNQYDRVRDFSYYTSR